MCRSNGSEAPVWMPAVLGAASYCEENLVRPVTVDDLARAAGYSLFYFTRVFNEATGHSPYDYLMRRRLSEAARDILDPDLPLAQVAARYQFGSPDTFARAFRRMFGRLPSEARKLGAPPRLWLRSPVTAGYIGLALELSRQAPVRRRLGALQPGKTAEPDALVYTALDGDSQQACHVADPDDPGITERRAGADWIGFTYRGTWAEALLVAEYLNQSVLPALGAEPPSPQALFVTESDQPGTVCEVLAQVGSP